MATKTNRATAPQNPTPPIRVDCEGGLAGHTILVYPDALTMGLLEDIQIGTAAVMLDAVATTLAGGDIPHGVDRAGLRRLTPNQFADLCTAVASCIRLGKGIATSL